MTTQGHPGATDLTPVGGSVQPVSASSPPGRKRRFRLGSRAACIRLGVLFLIILAGLSYCYGAMIAMPGTSFRGPLPPADDQLNAVTARLEADVVALVCDDKGNPVSGLRSTLNPRGMAAAARYIIGQLKDAGYAEHEEVFVERNARTPNIAVELRGTAAPSEIVVVGAHYDAFAGTPGADDNASGVAATLELARRFARRPQPRTLRLCFFVNEEPPSFMTDDMGSLVYAKHCRARNDNITAMLSLETMGFFRDEVGYQNYPYPLNKMYPETADFIAFVGTFGNRSLVKRSIATFRDNALFPSEGAALPGSIKGVSWSDHWAFEQVGYPAIMVTDTATFRNPHYHIASDRPETLDFERLARVVNGLEHVVVDLLTR